MILVVKQKQALIVAVMTVKIMLQLRLTGHVLLVQSELIKKL